MRQEFGVLPVVSIDELAEEYDLNRLFAPTSAKRDMQRLLGVISFEGVTLERSSEDLQAKGATLVRSASQRIASVFGSQIGKDRLQLLSTVYEGVLVVRKFKDVIPHMRDVIDFPSIPVLDRFLEVKLRMILDVHGLVIQPYNAILLSEEIFDEKTSEDEKLRIAIHETWHVLSDNELPMLLNEAATDIYTVRTLRGTEKSGRMSINHTLACQIWQEVERLTGVEMALEGYLERGIREETYILETGKVISTRTVDIKLHDFMRDVLGQNAKGETHWDVILDEVDKKKAIKAFALFFARKLLRKVEMPLF